MKKILNRNAGDKVLIELYCDESRQDLLVDKSKVTDNNRYVCIGGIWIPNEKRSLFKASINLLKQKYGINKEFKWGNVSTNKIDFYKELIDLFFDDQFKGVHFRCVVIDALMVDNKSYNSDDQELGYYKFYYQLLNNWLSSSNEYYVFTDFKTNKDRNRLHELKRITNRSLHGDYVKIVQAIDSSESVILQLQNILMGTVAYKFNYCDKGCSQAKCELVEYVESKLGKKIAHMPRSEQKFNVFKIELRGGCR